jgi:hypothetical protein
MIVAKSVFNRLEIVGAPPFCADHGTEVYSPRSFPSLSLTDLRSWRRGTSFRVVMRPAFNPP